MNCLTWRKLMNNFSENNTDIYRNICLTPWKVLQEFKEILLRVLYLLKHACYPVQVAPWTRNKPDAICVYDLGGDFPPALQWNIKNIQPGSRCGSIVCSCVGIIDLEWPGIDPFPRYYGFYYRQGFPDDPFLLLYCHIWEAQIWKYHIFQPILIISWDNILLGGVWERSMFPIGQCAIYVTPAWSLVHTLPFIRSSNE